MNNTMDIDALRHGAEFSNGNCSLEGPSSELIGTRLQRNSSAVSPRQDLIPVPLDDLMAEQHRDPEFTIYPWLPCRTVTLFGAHGGAGKTALALAIAAHVAAGAKFASMATKKGKVLFLTLEDEADLIKLRLRRIIDEYQLNREEVSRNLTLLDGTSGFSALMSESEGHPGSAKTTAAFSELKSAAQGASLIIIDNASDAFDANENSRRSVRTFIRSLIDIAREAKCSVLLLAHIDKAAARHGSNSNSYSGSTAWHNSCRSRLAIHLEEDSTLRVDQEKLNFGRGAKPLYFAFSDTGIPLPVKHLPNGADEKTVKEELEMLLRAFKAAEFAEHHVPSNLTPGGHSAMNALSNLPEYPESLTRGAGKKRAPKLLLQMIRDGLIVREKFRKRNRHDSERLVLASKWGKAVIDEDNTPKEGDE